MNNKSQSDIIATHFGIDRNIKCPFKKITKDYDGVKSIEFDICDQSQCMGFDMVTNTCNVVTKNKITVDEFGY